MSAKPHGSTSAGRPARFPAGMMLRNPGSAGAAAAPRDPGFRTMVPAGNLAGLPALVLPCGFAENLPLALQVVGVPFSENLLLAAGKEFQARTDWHKRRPPGV